MPRYVYGHIYAAVTKKGRMVQMGEWRGTKSYLRQLCNDWNDTHQTKRHVVKVRMCWPKKVGR